MADKKKPVVADQLTVKQVLNVTGAFQIDGTAVTATAAELNGLDGLTASVAELNILDGVTSSAAELNILDGVTSSAAELNILDGVTSSAAELNILDGVTATAAELNLNDNQVATATFVIGAETGGDEITVNIQLKDAAGSDMAIRSAVGFYLSSDANGDAIVAATTSLVAGTDGNMQEFISNSAGRLVSEADGDIDVVVGSAGGAATYYLVLIMPNGKLVVSTAITFA